MTTRIQCESCGTTVLSFRYAGMEPIGRDDCPRCGGQTFTSVDESREPASQEAND